MTVGSGRILVGPFNRVEGDLEVELEIDDGRVAGAYVNSPLFRGFEQILRGKDPRDALVVTPRICGICSVSQSMACAYALADALGAEVPPNGELSRNLILGTENVADHFSHFYLFFMPDFARDVYADEPWYRAVSDRFTALSGSAPREAIPARAGWMHLMGTLAGKWPHSLSLQPGGSTRALQPQELLRLRAQIAEFRHFLERATFGDKLVDVIALDSEAALTAWSEAPGPAASDLGLFLKVAGALSLEAMGRANDGFMSYGCYPADDRRLFAAGSWYRDAAASLDVSTIAEDVSHSWMRGDAPRHPSRGETQPEPDKAGAYSWCKAPRLDGDVVEVGALARQLVDGHPLIVDLVKRSGGNVRNRVVARLLETARLVVAMDSWVDAIKPGAPFCHQGDLPREADGVGLVEAARGSLGHWLQIERGRIANYQIVAPTTWNFSPRDHAGVPGALEQALVGAPVRAGEKTPVAVQHIVRSFDPCMVCTVH